MHFHHFHETRVIDSLFGVSSGLWAAAGTLILGILAIFGDPRKWFKKPEIVGIQHVLTTQYGIKYHRLIVKNIGRVPAREVRVLLTYLDAPENFIPVPLNWTHINKNTRDISIGEPAYIDIFNQRFLHKGDDSYWFCWAGEVGNQDDPSLGKFFPKNGKLRLEFFERDRELKDIELAYSEEGDKLIILNPGKK